MLFFFLAFIWGINWPLMKMGVQFVHPIIFVFHRFMFSAIVMIPVIFFTKKRIPRDKDTLRKLLPLVLIYASWMLASIAGLVEENSGIGAVLNYTHPFFVFFLSISLLNEKITKNKIIGTVTGFVGIIILFLNKIGSLMYIYALMMLFGAFCWAATTVYYKKYLSKVDPLVITSLLLCLGTPLLLIISLAEASVLFPTSTLYYWIVLYQAIGASAIGSSIWFFLIKEEDTTIVSSSSLIVPLFAIFLGWIFLGENIYIESAVGSALILIGVYIVNLKTSQNKC